MQVLVPLLLQHMILVGIKPHMDIGLVVITGCIALQRFKIIVFS